MTKDTADVSRETRERLQHLAELVEKWTQRINLVSRSSLKDLWTRHIEDSLQVFNHAPRNALSWADLGSGGGFPGLVVAVAAKSTASDLIVTLIESDQRKAAFLRTAIREIDLNATVLASRIEATQPQNADVVSARALADLPTLLGHFVRHAKPTGTGLFLKGRSWKKELMQAREQWSFQAEPIKSKTESEAVILKVKEVARV